MFQREQRSLFGEILDWMLTPLLLLWPISLVLTWFVAQSAAGKPFDQALEIQRRRTRHAGQGARRAGAVQPAAAGAQAAARHDADTVYYQIIGAAANCSAASATCRCRREAKRPSSARSASATTDYQGDDVRVAYKWLASTCRAPGRCWCRWPRAGQARRAGDRDRQGRDAAAIHHPAAGRAAGLAGPGLCDQAAEPARGAHPRAQARTTSARWTISLGPAGGRAAGLLGQRPAAAAEESIEHQKRFLADAAHQLKTPLAGLRMQADLAQREGAAPTSSSSRCARSAMPACARPTP
jgi:two-component system sensor histidine kinase TctE